MDHCDEKGHRGASVAGFNDPGDLWPRRTYCWGLWMVACQVKASKRGTWGVGRVGGVPYHRFSPVAQTCWSSASHISNRKWSFSQCNDDDVWSNWWRGRQEPPPKMKRDKHKTNDGRKLSVKENMRLYSQLRCLFRTKPKKVPGAELFRWCEYKRDNCGANQAADPRPRRRGGLGFRRHRHDGKYCWS